MSWMFKKNVQPRPYSAKFHLRRERAEGFLKPYIEPNPLYQLYKMLLAYPLRYRDFFYMTTSEYTNILMAVARDVAERYGWDVVKNASIQARRKGLIKDPPLLIAHVLPKRDMVSEVISEYPISKILLFAELGRKQKELKMPLGWGRMKKKAIEGVLNGKPLEWHEYQAIKYPVHYRDLVRMVHPKPKDEAISAIWGWLVKKRKAPTDRIKAYEEVLRERDLNRAVEIALEHRLPWDVIRSRVGNLSNIRRELLVEASWKLMSGFDIALQAKTLLNLIGEDELKKLVKSRSIDRNSLARASLSPLPKEVREVFYEKAKMSKEEALKEISLLGWKPKRVVGLIDVSGSMGGTGIESVARTLIVLKEIFDKTYVFSSFIEGLISEIELNTLDDFERLLRMPDGGTPLYDAIKMTLETEKLGEDDVLMIFTDEMENASLSSLEITQGVKTNVAVINVKPYPTDMIPKEKGRVVGIPGVDPNAVIGALRIEELRNMEQSEGVVEEKILKLFEEA